MSNFSIPLKNLNKTFYFIVSIIILTGAAAMYGNFTSSNHPPPSPITPPPPTTFVMSNIIGGNYTIGNTNTNGTFSLYFDNPLNSYTDVYFYNLGEDLKNVGGIVNDVYPLGSDNIDINYSTQNFPGYYQVCFDINNPNTGNIQTTCSDAFEIQ